MNLSPKDFEELQPHEFYKLLTGFKWRQENEENLLAYFTSWQMSVHTKKPVDATDLLKPLRPELKGEKKKSDAEYLKELFNLEGGEKNGNGS
ncbi:MAG: hypothetical protein RR384_07920 [Acidaminococcaceae bacterium]